MNIAFAKYHGLGNDFIVVDLRLADAATRARVQDPVVARALCDRQFGIGADGVLAVVTDGASARMRVLNADGSEAEMCGNGLRCVAQLLAPDQGSVAINTGAGRLAAEVSAESVTIDMGRPLLLRGEIPMTGPAETRCVAESLPNVPSHLKFTAVSMGNPHAVTFVDNRAEAETLARTIGPAVEVHPAFPKRTNAEFAAMRSRQELDCIVWERGVGITLACGTGACAAVVAACLLGHCDLDTDIAVHLLGGTLHIRVAADFRTVTMRGPATRVYEGVVDIDHVLRHARPS